MATVEEPELLTIGQLVSLLSDEFPGQISIPKVRGLEAEGLVTPVRTQSGYRKFTYAEVERLRYILRMQRDHYLPRKVIAEHLDAMDRGLQPPPLQPLVPTVPEVVLKSDGTPDAEVFRRQDTLRISRRELLKTAEISEEFLSELESYGLVTPRRGTQYFDTEALGIARTARELSDFGIEPRHLRAFRASADREVGLIEQVVTPHRKSGDSASADRVDAMAREVAALAVRLHISLVRSGLQR